MFFTYALLAVLFYSFHSFLIAPLYRQFSDKLEVVFYRGLCLSVSFSPALFLVAPDQFYKVGANLPLIILASALAVVGTWSAANSVNYLAIGTANTLLTAFSNILIVVVSVLIIGEPLSLIQVLIIILVLACVFILGFGQAHGTLPHRYNPKIGIAFCLNFAAFTGSSYILLGLISRESDPILVGYLWESIIGLCAGLTLLARKLLPKNSQRKSTSTIPSRKTLVNMLLRSSPSAAGTAFYAMAMSQGSIAIASACLNLCMVITTVLTVCFYGERLSKLQWFLSFAICLLVASLRFVN